MAGASNVRAGGAYVELFAKDGKLVGVLNRTAARLKAFGASVTNMGRRLAMAGVALGVPLLASAKLFADMGSEMLDMSQRTGMTVEALSELGYAAGQSGSSMEELETAVKFMQRGGFGRGAADLERIADELAAMPDPAQRTARAIEIFGRAGTRLLPLMSQGAAGIRELREEAQRLGISMSTEDAIAAESFGDAISSLMATLKKAVFNIGGALSPALKDLAGLFTSAAAATGKWIKENAAVIKLVGLAVVGLTALGIALMLLGPAITAIGMGISLLAVGLKIVIATVLILKGLIIGLASPLGLVLLALDLLRGYLITAAVQGTNTIGTLQAGFRNLANVAIQAWSGISDAIAAGEWALAGQIAMTGLQIAWRHVVTTMRRIWTDFANFFTDVFNEAVTTVATAIENLRRILSFTARDWRAIRNEMTGMTEAQIDSLDIIQRNRSQIGQQIVAARRTMAQEQGISYQEAAARDTAATRELVRQFNELGRLFEQTSGQIVTPETAPPAVTAASAAEEQRRENERLRAAAAARTEAADRAELQALQDQLHQQMLDAAEARAMSEDAARATRRAGAPETDLGALSKKIEAKGTFSAFAISGLGASSLTDRIARATEETARNTRNNAEPAFT